MTKKFTKNLSGLNETQVEYIRSINKFALTMAKGPAGTGKTLIACDYAVQQLNNPDSVYERVIIVRPAIATEDLGYLPGTLEEKLDPYLRPIFDAFIKRTGSTKTVQDWLKTGRIEIAPLAYMRGRTLENCVVILDEAQNTTIEQMKMFLTRFGDPVRAIITGDPSQSDLPGANNGFVWALNKLQHCDVVSQITFERNQVVRSELVRQLLEHLECQNQKTQQPLLI